MNVCKLNSIKERRPDLVYRTRSGTSYAADLHNNIYEWEPVVMKNMCSTTVVYIHIMKKRSENAGDPPLPHRHEGREGEHGKAGTLVMSASTTSWTSKNEKTTR